MDLRSALKSDVAAEKSKDQLSRDFLGRSIFDFCNNIGTNRTFRLPRWMSAFMGKADMIFRMNKKASRGGPS
jgi:hypothetical protein